MRKLVTVRVVSELRPILGADVIELAILDGWQCVVKKGEFKVGDKGIYFEIDSFIPASQPAIKFLEKEFRTWRGHHGARIRTIKLRGQLSQGLLLPATVFPEINVQSAYASERDLAADLGVLKWEREGESDKPREQKATWLGRKLKKLKYTRLKPFVTWLEKTFPAIFLTNATRPFPDFIPRTDEERIQNVIGKVDRSPSKMYEASVKLDGSSMTIYHASRRVGVCSRNLDLKKDPENKFWSTAIMYGLDKAIKKLGRNIALQGELMGPGIQGNREGLNCYGFYIYKIWDIDAKKYLGLIERQMVFSQLAEYGAHVDTVPHLGIFSLHDKLLTIEGFLEYAEGQSLVARTREGVVFSDAITGEKGFKVVANSYLLKEDK